MKYDFCGYATKNDLRCSDGRTIRQGAFKECDGETVPLVWSHAHGDVNNVLGHALLENRSDGVYTYGVFNDTPSGRNAKTMVEHGDITSLSIYANRLVQNGGDVVHGVIREVSLVLAGANPGAKIENVSFAHMDGTVFDSEDEVIIHSGDEFDDIDGELDDKFGHAEGDEDMSVQDVLDSMTDLQRNVVYGLIGSILEDEEMSHADDDEDDEEYDEDETVQDVIDSMTDKQRNVMYGIIGTLLSDEDEELAQGEEGNDKMRKNVFDGSAAEKDNVLSHDEMKAIFDDAQKTGSLKNAVLAHAGEYGIENIDVLFPEAKDVNGATPDWLKRDTEWVSTVLNGAKHNPFTRIRTRYADITADDARAKGYIKGRLKKEEFFRVAGRTTSPQTIYKKQKLDRDDILDITEFDVVSWIKGEMRLMLNEEIARAILIGDGRVPGDDKIDEECIRPIWKDHDLYTTKVALEANYTPGDAEEKIIRALTYYEGTGTPTFFTTREFLTDLMLMKDEFGRRYYKTKQELAEALGVSNVVTVDVMKNQTRTAEVTEEGTTYLDTYQLYGVIVNMNDYTIGADKGGQISMFDDFDIDYNQYKYLLETRISGALTKLKSAIAVEILLSHEAE